MANVKIYTLDDPITGEVKYVGKTARSLNKRYNEHLSSADTNKTRNKVTCWIKSLLSKELKPTMTLVDVVGEDWIFWEQHYICLYKSFGFNLKNSSVGGEGSCGFRHTEEHKSKLKIKMIGNTYALGFKQSEETCKAKSLATKGRVSHRKGKSLSPEHTAKIRAAKILRDMNNKLNKTK